MLTPGPSILSKNGPKGPAASPMPAWPPTNALRVHPGASYTGTTDDVQSITFDNGMTMSVTGEGDPVRIDGAGLHFNRGKYLSYEPTEIVSFDGIAVFGKITIDPPTDENGDPVSNIGWLYPITISGAGEGLLSLFPPRDEMISDLGNISLWRGKSAAEMLYGAPMTIGVQFDMLSSEYGGRYALWHDGAIVQARTDAEPVTPTAWEIGRNFQGTIHEGVVLSRRQGLSDPLFPPGGSSQWAMDNLAPSSS